MQGSEAEAFSHFVSQIVLPASARCLDDMGPRELSTCLSALATLRHQPTDAWLSMLLDSAESQLCCFSPRDLSTLIWALGTLHHGVQGGPPDPLFSGPLQGSLGIKDRTYMIQPHARIFSFIKAAEVACLGCMRRFNPQDLSTLSVGLARLGHSPSDPWVDGFLRQTAAVLPHCGTQVRSVIKAGVSEHRRYLIRGRNNCTTSTLGIALTCIHFPPYPRPLQICCTLLTP